MNTIPDLFGRASGGIGEVKNVLQQSLTTQIKAQLKAAEDADIPYNLIVSPRTRRVTNEIIERAEASGGGVFVFDAATGQINPWVR